MTNRFVFYILANRHPIHEGLHRSLDIRAETFTSGYASFNPLVCTRTPPHPSSSTCRAPLRFMDHRLPCKLVSVVACCNHWVGPRLSETSTACGCQPVCPHANQVYYILIASVILEMVVVVLPITVRVRMPEAVSRWPDCAAGCQLTPLPPAPLPPCPLSPVPSCVLDAG